MKPHVFWECCAVVTFVSAVLIVMTDTKRSSWRIFRDLLFLLTTMLLVIALHSR